MDKKTRNLIRGAGSIIDIMPSRNLRKVVEHQSAKKRMASHFGRVAETMSRACAQFENDNKAALHKK